MERRRSGIRLADKQKQEVVMVTTSARNGEDKGGEIEVQTTPEHTVAPRLPPKPKAHFPMYVMKGSSLCDLDELPTHEEALASGKLLEVVESL